MTVALLASGGCQSRNAYVPPPPPDVVVGTPQVKSVTLYHEFPGTTQASQSVNIVPRVLGYIDSINFVDGSMVKVGQLLFVIDPRPYQDAYDVALAQVKVAQAAAGVARANYARAEEVAKTPGAISKQQLDTYRSTEEQAQANLQLAQANAANAKLNVDFTHITAPIGGKIGRHLVDIGNLVNSNITLLTTIDNYNPMFAYFNVSEADFLAYLKREREAAAKQPHPAAGNTTASNSSAANTTSGNTSTGTQPQHPPVEMGLSDETGYPHQGTIDFADNQVDPTSGTLLIRGVFPNPEPYRLAPGLFVRIRVPIGTQPNAILVPDRAIGTDQQGKFLLVVQSDNMVEHRAVTIGSLAAADMRIIESGVKPGERFIVEGLQFARPGARVHPVTQPANPGGAVPPQR